MERLGLDSIFFGSSFWLGVFFGVFIVCLFCVNLAFIISFLFG